MEKLWKEAIVPPPLFKNKNSSAASASLSCNFQRVRTEKYIFLLLQVALLSIEKILVRSILGAYYTA